MIFEFRFLINTLLVKNMEYIFHELQDGSLCAQHCLNSLLQGDYYSAVDLASLAEQLDKQERVHMSEASTSTKDYEQFLTQESSNYDDSGFFSIQVLQKALSSWNLDLIPYASKNPLALEAQQHPTEQKAFICNFKEHWYTIRKIGNYWFNLNSLFKKPQLISDTYLAILLAQLQADGYSIFIVAGDLPLNMKAETKLLENPLNSKEILASYNIKSNQQGREEVDDDDDDELKQALKMSLIENDMDLDRHRRMSKLYPSLAVDLHHNQDDDLKKAIELSLQSESNVAEPISAEEMRQKRLAHFGAGDLSNLPKKD